MTLQSADVYWDLSTADSWPSPAELWFRLFLTVIFFVTLVKLLKAWFLAPPFGKVREVPVS